MLTTHRLLTSTLGYLSLLCFIIDSLLLSVARYHLPCSNSCTRVPTISYLLYFTIYSLIYFTIYQLLSTIYHLLSTTYHLLSTTYYLSYYTWWLCTTAGQATFIGALVVPYRLEVERRSPRELLIPFAAA